MVSIKVELPADAMGRVAFLASVAYYLSPKWEQLGTAELKHLVIFVIPPVEAHLEGKTGGVLGDHIANTPVPLVVLCINEVFLLVVIDSFYHTIAHPNPLRTHDLYKNYPTLLDLPC